MKRDNDLLPEKELVIKYMNDHSTYIRQYYGITWQDRIRSWIFKRRYKVVMDFLSEELDVYGCVLDVGCGPMFIAYSILKKFNANYIGIDILPSSKLRQYSKIIEKITRCPINVIRASAEKLPFRKNIFNITLSLDVLEHLLNPNMVLHEINEVTKDGLIISLPLENVFQRITRMPILFSEGIYKDPTSEYHYIGVYKSYNELWEQELREKIIHTKYVPFGFINAINYYAIHFLNIK